jgi:hypothetical protein
MPGYPGSSIFKLSENGPNSPTGIIQQVTAFKLSENGPNSPTAIIQQVTP